MKIEEINELLNEIAPEDNPEYRWIDCSDTTGYADDNQYQRIVTAIKQNIKLQQTVNELNKKIEELENQNNNALSNIEYLNESNKEVAGILEKILKGIGEHLLDIYSGKENEVRVGDYMFFINKDHVDFEYRPIKKEEPIELTIKVTENSDNIKLCPICGFEIDKYPAISRKDNKTKICSNCGVLEALEAFNTSMKEDANK